MTPRRIVLTILTLAVFGAAYSGYDRLFGWIDGLPVFPDAMLVKSDSKFRPPPRATSPTIERLEEAYGKNSPETEPAFYPTQLEFRTGDTSIVVAAGQPPSNPASNKVMLSPFSAAVFGKPRPAHLLQPGEVVEISTFHSDKAMLVFDRIINSPTDMSTAKLVQLELISDPEQTLPDPRKGRVHITNNQRSADPNRRLTLKTVGPVIYRDTTIFVLNDRAFNSLKQTGVPEALLAKLRDLKDMELSREDFVREMYARLGEKEPAVERWKNAILSHASSSPTGPRRLGPDIRTDAPIEVVDHSNIPHRQGTDAATAIIASEEFRNPTAVADVLRGRRLPPPTVTAVGMRVYLSQEDSSKPAKQGSTGFSGVREVELVEQVVMHLWMEAGQGLVGGEGKSSAVVEPTPAAAAAAGELLTAAIAAKEQSRDLLQIETRGSFYYYAEKNTARFDVLPQADPNLTNDVRATKITTRPGLQTLFSQVLEIEFNGSPVGSNDPQPPKPAPKATPTAGKSPEAKPGGGPQFKRLHAWTYTPGRFLTISSDPDQMTAYGQDLVRTQATDAAPESTKLTGFPLYASQQRSTLQAGAQNTPGILISEPAPNGTDRCTTVLGPGTIELYDATVKASTMKASWQRSMIQTKEKVNERELDLYTFTDGAELKDLQSDYWLRGREIKLWTAPSTPGQDGTIKPADGGPSIKPADGGPSPGSRMQIHQLLAKDDVTAHSNDLDIEQTDRLFALFRDVPPPEPAEPRAGAGGGPAPAPAAPGASGAPSGPVAPTTPGNEPKEPEKPKPPMKLKARSIDTTWVRYPMPAAPGGAKPKPAAAAPAPGENTAGGMKYQIERARCEGNVIAHQDPDDPAKPRGTDIFGKELLIDGEADGSGSRLTVIGWDFKPGEVHNEGTSLIGPKVIIDQIHNVALIEGRGSVMLPANGELGGPNKKPDQKPDQKAEPKAENVLIHFRDKMTFEGSQKVAEFIGKVNASQGESWIVCDTMKVNLDKPVYFSQMNRPAPPKNAPRPITAGPQPADDEQAKIDVVYCYPAPADRAENDVEKKVYFTQIEREPGTGKPVRKQQLAAHELTLRAQVKDEGRGDPYRLVLADGPGVARMWGPESKDDDSANGKPLDAKSTPTKSAEPKTTEVKAAEVEMKLTVIFFTGRMIAKDKGDAYKEATFYDNIHVINLPTENPDLTIERNRLPATALQLTCRERLVVWSHKNPRLPDEPAVQYMHAKGNAYLQNEEYDGWGEEIRSEGKVVWFDGTRLVPARIKSRFKGSDNSGLQIRLDRALNRYTVIQSTGGTFIEGNGGGNDDGLKKLPPPTTPAPSGNKNGNGNGNSNQRSAPTQGSQQPLGMQNN